MLDLMTTQKAQDWLSEARGHVLGVDTETNGKDVRNGQGYLIGLSLSYQSATGYRRAYFPFRHLDTENNLPKALLSLIDEVLHSAPMLVFHNAKFDLVSLITAGIDCFGTDWYCTMVISHLIDENWPRAKSLNEVAKTYLGPGFEKRNTPEMDAIIEAFGWEYVPVAFMHEYGSWDAELALRIMGALYERFVSEGLLDYWPYKRKLIETVALLMESRGVGINTVLCEDMLERAEKEMAQASAALGGFNPRSSKDMEELLINQLHLPPQYHPKTGNLTFDKNAMAVYEPLLERMNSPVANHILTYRGWGHAASNFYRAYLMHLSPDGKIRPSYMHHKDEDEGGTVTGRLSCKDPNLQQIPRVSQKAWNGQVKKAFQPSPGYKLWEVDFSQLELRLASCYANERTLKEIFIEGRDVFSEMAESLGMARHDTKTLVYTLQYGGGIKRLMDVFGVTETGARNIKENYFTTYPNFRTLFDLADAKVKSRGYIRIWSGRRRHFRHPASESFKALNSLIQGGAADLMERRMIALGERLDDNVNFRMLLQVHDSIIGEVKIGEEQEILPEWQRIMSAVSEDNPAFNTKFAVEAKPFGE